MCLHFNSSDHFAHGANAEGISKTSFALQEFTFLVLSLDSSGGVRIEVVNTGNLCLQFHRQVPGCKRRRACKIYSSPISLGVRRCMNLSPSQIISRIVVTARQLASFQIPSEAQLLFSTSIEFKGIPMERIQSELWWRALSKLSPQDMYTKLLPSLVQRPLADYYNDEELTPGRVHQLKLETQITPKAAKSSIFYVRPMLETLRLVMLSFGLQPNEADSWFLHLRASLMTTILEDVRAFPLGENPVPLESEDVAALGIIQGVMAYEAAAGDPEYNSAFSLHMLRDLELHVDSIHQEMQKHMDLSRPTAPPVHTRLPPTQTPNLVQASVLLLTKLGFQTAEMTHPHLVQVLALLPPQRADIQQWHPHFDGFDPKDTTFLKGKSTMNLRLGFALTNEQGGVLHGSPIFEEALQLRHDPSNTTFARCIATLRECLETCLQLKNMTHLKWQRQLVCAIIARTFLKVLPLPTVHSRLCIWQRGLDELTPLQAMSMSGTALQMLRLLMELLAQHSNAQYRTPDDATRWHPTLLVVGGVIASIADALARYGAEQQHATCLSQMLAGRRLVGDGAPTKFGLSVHNFERLIETLTIESPELYIASTAVIDYFQKLQVPSNGFLFEVTSESFYSEGCATKLFVHQLVELIQSPAEDPLNDPDADLESIGAENAAFVDICVYWKLFIHKSSPMKPFIYPGVERFHFHLQYVANLRDTYFKDVPASIDIPPSPSSADFFVSHSKLQGMASEEDVLHLRVLPDFNGQLSQSQAELLLQYLCVPYLRVP